ncbi:Histone-like transcription factor [Gracilaria domingensis]|nr:Histone-like transcription factor [Gracilaria domingensis]
MWNGGGRRAHVLQGHGAERAGVPAGAAAVRAGGGQHGEAELRAARVAAAAAARVLAGRRRVGAARRQLRVRAGRHRQLRGGAVGGRRRGRAVVEQPHAQLHGRGVGGGRRRRRARVVDGVLHAAPRRAHAARRGRAAGRAGRAGRRHRRAAARRGQGRPRAGRARARAPVGLCLSAAAPPRRRAAAPPSTGGALRARAAALEAPRPRLRLRLSAAPRGARAAAARRCAAAPQRARTFLLGASARAAPRPAPAIPRASVPRPPPPLRYIPPAPPPPPPPMADDSAAAAAAAAAAVAASAPASTAAPALPQHTAPAPQSAAMPPVAPPPVGAYAAAAQMASHSHIMQHQTRQAQLQQQQSLQELNAKLAHFWSEQMSEVQAATDFKNHLLPLARIKKIMKSDEDVRMISAEAPVLFAKACEMFILELTHRAWAQTEEAKRRTLQRSDISAAIQKTDIFDFLIDIVPRDDPKKDDRAGAGAVDPAQLQYYSMPNMPPPAYPIPAQIAGGGDTSAAMIYQPNAQQVYASAGYAAGMPYQAGIVNPQYMRMPQQVVYAPPGYQAGYIAGGAATQEQPPQS